jgi:hypothetical protein
MSIVLTEFLWWWYQMEKNPSYRDDGKRPHASMLINKWLDCTWWVDFSLAREIKERMRKSRGRRDYFNYLRRVTIMVDSVHTVVQVFTTIAVTCRRTSHQVLFGRNLIIIFPVHGGKEVHALCLWLCAVSNCTAPHWLGREELTEREKCNGSCVTDTTVSCWLLTPTSLR